MAESLKSREASFNNAWQDLTKHGPALALTYLSLIVISILSAIVYFVISLIFVQVGGGPYSDSGPLLGVLAGSLGSLPLYMLSSLVGVLFIAIPSIYFSKEEPVSFGDAIQILKARPGRYLLAGVLFLFAYFVGVMLCFVPGIAVLLVTPVYVNKIFNTDLSVTAAFSSSFSVVFKGEGWSFVGAQVLVMIIASVLTVCTCGLGGLIAVPMAAFYLQNVAYNKGLLTQ